MAAGPVNGEACPGCPIAPTALESTGCHQSAPTRQVRRGCFDQWEGLIASRLRADGWPETSVCETTPPLLLP